MSKKTLTDEELLAQFADIPSADEPPPVPAPAPAAPAADDDPLAELSALAAARPASRPNTPRPSSSTASGHKSRPEHTPASSGPPSARTSEDRQKLPKSAESARPQQPQQPHPHPQPQPQPHPHPHPQQQQQPPHAPGGGWWGSVFNVATAAVKQAEQAVKEVRGNPDVLKYAEQLRANVNVDNLRAYGDNVRSLALPTFTNLLQTIAPPISQHERLQIHTTHDLLAYPSLDPVIYDVFARVMSQVEGGDLLVIQRGSESRHRGRSPSDLGYRGSVLGSPAAASWTDGPWWREPSPRSLGAVPGLVEGSKLCRANAEAYATDFFAARGGLEAAAKHATDSLSDANPVRRSDIFLAIQPLSQPAARDVFAAGPQPADPETGVVEPDGDDDDDDDETVLFAVYLHDPVHSLSFGTLSQSFPAKWALWLDEASPDPDALPESIRDIVESGGIDPREWVADWIQEVLSLAIGVVAQSYVAKRMGVGEGGIGRGKARQNAEESDAGEAARAI